MTVSVYQLEVTNACNLRCHFCPTFQPWNDRATGLMDLSLIDCIDWSGTAYVELQKGGEPLLHPKLKEIVLRVKAKGVKVGFSTNAHPLLRGRLEAVLDLVDAITVNDDEYREPLFTDRPNVFVQRLGVTYPFMDYTRMAPAPVPPCSTPEESVSIHWNGDVTPCCVDQSGVHVFGNLYEQTFQEVIDSGKRADFLEGLRRRNENQLCEYCDGPNPHLIHERILEQIEA